MPRAWMVLRLLLMVLLTPILIVSLVVSAVLCPEIVFNKTKWMQARPTIERARLWLLYGSKCTTTSANVE